MAAPAWWNRPTPGTGATASFASDQRLGAQTLAKETGTTVRIVTRRQRNPCRYKRLTATAKDGRNFACLGVRNGVLQAEGVAAMPSPTNAANASCGPNNDTPWGPLLWPGSSDLQTLEDIGKAACASHPAVFSPRDCGRDHNKLMPSRFIGMNARKRRQEKIEFVPAISYS